MTTNGVLDATWSPNIWSGWRCGAASNLDRRIVLLERSAPGGELKEGCFCSEHPTLAVRGLLWLAGAIPLHQKARRHATSSLTLA